MLPALLSGDESATWAVTGPGGDGSPDGAVSSADGAAGRLRRCPGTKTLVQDAHRSAWILVTAAYRRRAGHSFSCPPTAPV